MECEIVVDEAYPVATLFPIDDHWSDPEHHVHIQWLEVPDSLIQEYNAVTLLYQRMQNKLLELYREAERVPTP